MKKIVPYIILLFFVIIGYIAYDIKHNKEKVVTKTDTLYINRTDSFIITKPKLVYEQKIKVVKDTILDINHDTVVVNIPISSKTYSDTIIQDKDTFYLNNYVSGYKQKLDSIKLKANRNVTIVNNTTIVKTKVKKWNIGPQIGITYDYPGSKIKPYVGIGITYSILSF